ncbi:MAG: hypothetical protein R3E14_01375 [Erythrobacter sp.]
MKRLAQVLLIGALSWAGPAFGQEARTLTWGGYEVTSTASQDRVHVDQSDGVEVLTVSRGSARLQGADFSEGVIEFDIAFDDSFGFGGIQWHITDNSAEYFYIRQHKSGQPDAGQYTPVRNGLTSWQIFTDRNGIAPLAFTHEGWNHFKMVVIGDKAEIYFNGSDDPQLHIPDLATDQGMGGLGFLSSGPAGELRLANLVVRALGDGDRLVSGPAEVPALPDGVIESWAISRQFPETLVKDALVMPAAVGSLASVAVLPVEANGIADLGRAAVLGDEDDSLVASVHIRSTGDKRVRLKFGYSDRLRLFLNGELLFEGNAGWRTRDHFYLGTVGFLDEVVLPLGEGSNRLDAVVSETFGGWAIAGAIADREGLKIAAEPLE